MSNIGLIIGGVLVGQDLIQAAAIRSQISQIEKYNTAVRTFQGKYNCLPGDCANAAQFGFLARSGGVGNGDGNGLISGCYNGVLSTAQFDCETAFFWSDLGNAGLVLDGNFSAMNNGCNTITTNSNPLPVAKLGNGNYIAVFSGGSPTYFETGLNYFYLGGIPSTDANCDYVGKNAISPQQAYKIDSKTDDGQPATGSISTAVASGGIQYDTNYPQC